MRAAETALCIERNLFGALCGAYDCKRFAEVSIGGVAVVALFVIGARTAEREEFAALYVTLISPRTSGLHTPFTSVYCKRI